MWLIVILAAVAVAFLLLLVVASRSDTIPRQIGPDEGIDDAEIVKAYDRISQWPQFKVIRRIIIHELKRHHPQGMLVDVGCGTGYFLIDMARAFNDLKFVGVDISSQMVEKATGNITSSGFIERVSFRVGDILRLPFESNSIDFVVSTLSLHHWIQPSQGLEEILRVLKPGGQFLVFDLKRNSPRLAYWLVRFAQSLILPAALGRHNEPTSSFLASYTPVEIEALMKDTGFTTWRVRAGLFWLFVWGQKQTYD
ncbi:class I SAM-dependent methyltransferase [Chloroflexota bacterium]